MKYFVYDLQCKSYLKVDTEVRFNIAAARSLGGELVRFNISPSDDEVILKRRYNFLLKILGQMRRDGAIQFYAVESDFVNKTMKSEFIYNKYSEIVSNDLKEGFFAYVKL